MSGSNKFGKNAKLFMSTSLIISAATVPFSSSFVEAKFVDVSGNTHETAINALAERNLLKGYSNDIFKPYERLTRSHVVKIIGRYLVEEENLRIPADYKSNIRFADLKTNQDDELLRYAAVVADSNIFIGTNGNLNPGSYITREQIALVVMRMFDRHFTINSSGYIEAQPNFETGITDLNRADPGAVEAINMLDYFDITIVNEYQPKTNTARGQFASFIYRLLQKMDEPNLERTLEEYKQQVLIQPDLLEVNTTDKALVGAGAKPGTSITAKDTNDSILGSTTVKADGTYIIPLEIDENTEGPIVLEANNPDVGRTTMPYTEINISDLASDVGQNPDNGGTPGEGDTPGGGTPGGGDTPGGSTPGGEDTPGEENPDDASPSTIDTSALETVIAEAAAIEQVAVSTNGTDIPVTEEWTTQEELDAFTAALDDAQVVLENEDATQEEVDAAAETLTEAITAYNAAKQAGTQINENVDYTELEEAISAAAGVDRVAVSTDGSDVSTTEQWTTQEDLDAFIAALREVETLLENEGATQAEVDAAAADLREAVEAYNNAKQPGTQTDEDVSAIRDALQELIVEAEQVERATISENGSDVASDEEWTTQEESDTFDNAISDAREVAGNESAAREEIEEATILLQLAINRYNNAKQQSTQAIRSEYEVNQISLNYGYDERTEDLGGIQRGTTDLSFTTLDATLSPLISADVLSTPNVGANFIVEEGKEFKFNVRATVSGVVGTGRVGLAVYKKTNEGYEKVWDDNFDYLTLLGIPIQNKYNFRTPYFGPGEYEFVTSPDSNFNLDLISGGAFSFTDTTLREYTGNIPGGETIQRQGTVTFTDGASISQVRSLTSENASPIEIEDETTVIEGKYGQLTINPATGDYTYTSSGDSASVGQLDEFEYTVVHEGNEPVTNRIVILTTSASSTNVAANAENSRVANAADMPSITYPVNTSGLTAAFNLTANLLPLRYTLLNGEIAAGTVDYNGLS